MLKSFKRRVETEELMDLPQTSLKEFNQALEDIRWVNRHLNGIGTVITGLSQLLRTYPDSLRILDLGSGSADLPIAMVEWGQKHGMDVHVVAVDNHPFAVAAATQMTVHYPTITIRQADGLQLDDADASFDIITCSMCLHHLSDDEAVRLLSEMNRLCKIGFVVNDLERHPLAYGGIWLIGKILNKGAVFQNDAPLSVKRGFVEADFQRLKKETGLSNMQWQRVWPFRLLLTCLKQSLHRVH